ncbi:hypothetical protein B0T25DRAFT_630794 [Lasiosphaeria hispida]|uniref:Uncharacterized protein n=1 Tax=Lasiosphaeria hispida TaxID=260671 RepID=A0AAJ0HN63_9PEZI|nr:hypothetical protein B0T25DRAFT_630794 [Lasiosphaeria hispida]
MDLPDFGDIDLPDLDGIDFDDPSHFAKLYGPDSVVPAFKAPDDVRKEARERSRIIHDTYNILHAIVERHEETIQKRWTKRTRQQKLRVLLDCWPGMAAVHRPDFDAWRKESEQNPSRNQGTKYPEHFMWPYINQEDLSKPRSLLLLLGARTRYHPSHFAAADITAVRLGLVTKSIVPIFLNGFDSLAVMAAETPYRPPARIDFAQMESLLEAKVSAAKDHIWALREDPDYFAGQMIDIREHRQEMLKDTEGKPHPALRPSRNVIVSARVIGNLVMEAYSELEIFTELHRQAKKLRLLHGKYAPQLSAAEDLPAVFLDGLLTFRHYLRQAAKGPLGQLRFNVVASPPMRGLFVRQPPPNATTSYIAVIPMPGHKRTKVEVQLLWLLSTLWDDGNNLFFAGMPLILDELQRLLEAEPHAADLVSSRIAEIISSASIIGQCLSRLNQYQPWARGFDFAEADKLEDMQKSFSVWARPLSYLVNGTRDQNFVRVADLGNTSHRRFFYPSEKRRTKENIEALRSAERNLDEFWQAVDGIVDANCDDLWGTAVWALLSGNRVLLRTPEWVDNSSLATNKLRQQQAATDGAESLFRPLSTLYFNESGEEAGQGKVPITAKTKTKTKGETKEPTPLPAALEQVDNKQTESTPIQVDNRALKVFRTLFFNPGVTSSPGEVAWHDFVHAMTSTGLFAAEKLYGSAWQFQRLDTESQVKIQFHQPHPRGKIPFTMARRMGRRLFRAFGWAGGMFVLKGDEKAQG